MLSEAEEIELLALLEDEESAARAGVRSSPVESSRRISITSSARSGDGVATVAAEFRLEKTTQEAMDALPARLRNRERDGDNRVVLQTVISADRL